jgi:hypothetical protein
MKTALGLAMVIGITIVVGIACALTAIAVSLASAVFALYVYILRPLKQALHLIVLICLLPVLGALLSHTGNSFYQIHNDRRSP